MYPFLYWLPSAPQGPLRSFPHGSQTQFTNRCSQRLFMEFSRQEYWSGLSFPSPGDLNPGLDQGVSHIVGRFFTI